MTNALRHSEDFIKEMKSLLLQQKDEIKAELDVIAKKDHGDYRADFPDYGRHDEENASEVADYQALNATTEALEERLQAVEGALDSIAQDKYGVTAGGELIPEDRLRANPSATTLVE